MGAGQRKAAEVAPVGRGQGLPHARHSQLEKAVSWWGLCVAEPAAKLVAPLWKCILERVQDVKGREEKETKRVRSKTGDTKITGDALWRRIVTAVLGRHTAEQMDAPEGTAGCGDHMSEHMLTFNQSTR